MTETHEQTTTDQVPAIDGYILYASSLVLGEQPRLTLECPPGHCPDDDHDRCSISRGCTYNLLPGDHRHGHINLGALIDLAIDHEMERALDTPPACAIIDVPEVGPTRVQGAAALDAGGRQAVSELVRAAQRKALEEIRAEGRAALIDKLTALRRTWAGRQQKEIYTRETADGPSADIASVSADLIGQLLAELDLAVNGG